MQPAAEAMAAALAEVTISAPRCRWSPMCGRGGERSRRDPRAAGAAGHRPVRWRESVEWMAGQGVTEIWEIGAGKALSGMVRRIDAETRRRAPDRHARTM
jgi:[acyl-carrier-protein] S-malonyltransferase